MAFVLQIQWIILNNHSVDDGQCTMTITEQNEFSLNKLFIHLLAQLDITCILRVRSSTLILTYGWPSLL